MACVMANAEQQGRLVSEWELSLMWPMITQSNNDATDALWSDLGGGPGVAACLSRLGVAGITPYNGPYWGTSTASARGMASAHGTDRLRRHRERGAPGGGAVMLVSVDPRPAMGRAGRRRRQRRRDRRREGRLVPGRGRLARQQRRLHLAAVIGRAPLRNRRHDQRADDAGVRDRDHRRAVRTRVEGIRAR